MARGKTIKLEVADKDVTVHAPTAGVLLDAAEKYKEVAAQGAYIARTCANMTEQEFRALDVLDMNALQEAVGSFLGRTEA
jgi:hypothetical protein